MRKVPECDRCQFCAHDPHELCAGHTIHRIFLLSLTTTSCGSGSLTSSEGRLCINRKLGNSHSCWFCAGDRYLCWNICSVASISLLVIAYTDIEAKQIEVATWITHRYHSLEALSQAFTTDHQANDYIKGVFVLPS